MDLSIAMPVYNVEQYLAQSINSVLNTNWGGYTYELIIVNDGSTDNSRNVLEKYENLMNVVILNQENGGLVAAREAGLKVAQGKYVTFLDSDDWVDPNYFPLMLDFMSKNNLDIGVSGFTKAYVNKKSFFCLKKAEHIIDRDAALAELFNWNYYRWELCSKVYRREVIINTCISHNIKCGEDCARNVIAFNNASIVGFIPLTGYYYRQRSSSMTKEKKKIPYEELISYVFEKIVNRQIMSGLVRKSFMKRRYIFAVDDYFRRGVSINARKHLKEIMYQCKDYFDNKTELSYSTRVKEILALLPYEYAKKIYSLLSCIKNNNKNDVMFD